MSLEDLPDDCLHQIAKFVVLPDALHPVCVRAREAAELATVSKFFRTFTNNHLYTELATGHCPPGLPTWPLPGYGDWDTAERNIPRFTIAQLKPILRATGCKVSGLKADLVERALHASPKLGKAALHRLQKETKRQLSQPCSVRMFEEFKMTYDDLHRATGKSFFSFKDIINAATGKYGTAAGLQQAAFTPPVHRHRQMCVCGGYHTVSEDSDEDMYDDSDYYSDSDEADYMMNAQVAGMMAAFANPLLFNHYPFPF